MGKIIQNGFDFVARANGHLIRNVDDMAELKHELIALSETKSHRQLAEYALLLAEHVVDTAGLERTGAVAACFDAVAGWLAGQVTVRQALDMAGALNARARDEREPVTCKALRALGQVAATPHVRWHPLVAAEYAVVMINLLSPKDIEAVKRERELQLLLLGRV